MAGPLTYAAVLILARDRIGQIKDMLRAKIDSAPAGDVNDIERHVLRLAERAHTYLQGASTFPPPARIYGPPLDNGVSRFAMLGAVGLEIPRFAPGPWMVPVMNTLHAGTPDDNREAVLASSTDFVLNLWDEASGRIGDPGTDAAKLAAIDQIRGCVLGHLCHVATDVVVHPFLDGLDLPRTAAASALDVHVSQNFLNLGAATNITATYANLWPHDPPSVYFDSFRAAFQRTYGARRQGFGAFEQNVASLPAGDFTTLRLEDGLRSLATTVDMVYGWNLADWMGATFWMFLPALIALPLAAALPQGSLLYRTPADLIRLGKTLDSSVAHYEIAVLSFAANALVPFVVTLVLTIAGLPGDAPLVMNWVNSVAWIIAAIAFLATLADDRAEWWQWLFLLVVPLVLDVVTTIVSIAGAAREPRQLQLVLAPILHLLCALMFLGLYHGFLHKGAEAAIDGNAGEFIGWFALWLLFLAALWMVTALIMWGGFNEFRVAVNPLLAGVVLPRVYDDTVLFRQRMDGGAAGDTPTLAELFYPSGSRPLLKLWWEGDANPPKIRPNRDALIFRHGAATDQIIAAPREPTKLSEFRDRLVAAVKDSAGNRSGRLHAKLAFETAIEDYELPPGALFADNSAPPAPAPPGDFIPLPTTEATAYVLGHAPRERLAVRVGQRGAVDPTLRPSPIVPTTGVQLTTPALPAPQQQVRRTAGTDSLFDIFRPGDVVDTTAGPNQQRVVVSVDDDDLLTVSAPFSPPLAGTAFRCLPRDPTVDLRGTGTVTVGPGATDLTGAGTSFAAELRPGDVIRIQLGGAPPAPPQDRMVVSVASQSLITIDTPFGLPAGVGPLPFTRIADLHRERVTFIDPTVPLDDNVFVGGTAMNNAADLAAMLMMGAASHVMPAGDRARASIPGASSDLNKVYQVFRNWNLDRRRMNEWKMLVLGDAVSEKRGAVTAPDPAVSLPAGSPVRSEKGEPTSNALGWLPTMRAWLDMARRPAANTKGQEAFRADNPTNLDLSRALGFLFDIADPDPAAP